MNALSLSTEAVMFLAEEPAKGPEFGKASPVGLLIILLLLVAVFLLIRSMNKQLKKLPESFDTENPGPDQAFDEGTDRVDGGPSSTEANADHGAGDGGRHHGDPTERG
ncbi:hypothetical protein [Gordonia phthalatica]|uniref:Uncharacterized protein n=1 Tax=Gordonia phthalatica TaxID=1136941 RepID=A0A0N9NAJ5_9ACTN|nr:hypothetical protein [Gordonia phthalatica]ALG84032.1 hypothetical protein ACH46_05300 [Gordonia phthalatica]